MEDASLPAVALAAFGGLVAAAFDGLAVALAVFPAFAADFPAFVAAFVCFGAVVPSLLLPVAALELLVAFDAAVLLEAFAALLLLFDELFDGADALGLELDFVARSDFLVPTSILSGVLTASRPNGRGDLDVFAIS